MLVLKVGCNRVLPLRHWTRDGEQNRTSLETCAVWFLRNSEDYYLILSLLINTAMKHLWYLNESSVCLMWRTVWGLRVSEWCCGSGWSAVYSLNTTEYKKLSSSIFSQLLKGWDISKTVTLYLWHTERNELGIEWVVHSCCVDHVAWPWTLVNIISEDLTMKFSERRIVCPH